MRHHAFAKLHPFQRVNHFPGGSVCTVLAGGAVCAGADNVAGAALWCTHPSSVAIRSHQPHAHGICSCHLQTSCPKHTALPANELACRLNTLGPAPIPPRCFLGLAGTWELGHKGHLYRNVYNARRRARGITNSTSSTLPSSAPGAAAAGSGGAPGAASASAAAATGPPSLDNPFDIVPRFYLLPRDYDEFRNDSERFPERLYIQKV